MPRFLLALIVRRQIVVFVLEILSKRFGSNFFRFEQPDFYISDSRRGNFEFTIGIVFHKKFHQPLLFFQILDELNFSSYQNTFGLHAVAARHVRVLVEDPVVVGAKSYANAVIFFQQAHVPAMRIGVEDDFAIGISEIHGDNIRAAILVNHSYETNLAFADNFSNFPAIGNKTCSHRNKYFESLLSAKTLISPLQGLVIYQELYFYQNYGTMCLRKAS